MDRTSQISYPRAPKHADELTRGSAVVADRYHVAERTVPGLHDVAEHIDEAVGGCSAREDDDAMGRRTLHGE